jgi:hypothetical protein
MNTTIDNTTVAVIEHNHISQNEQEQVHQKIHPVKTYHQTVKECQDTWHHYVHEMLGENALGKNHSIDFMNDILGDSTLNTDRKMQDAMFGTCPDQTIYSNASSDNSVMTSDEGLAGFDSRENLLALICCRSKENNSIQYLGVVENIIHYPVKNSHLFDKARYSHLIKFPG